MKSDSLYIVMPAYNEEANIAKVVSEWYTMLEISKSNDSRLVVADNGCTDSTHKILLNLQTTHEKLIILSDTEKYHGPKVIALYDYSIKNGANYIFQTDSDGQTEPKEFEKFWEERMTYDVILGHRNAREDGKMRAGVELVVCVLLKLIFGVNVPDANAPFRLMKADIVKKYLYKLPRDYNLPNIMLTTYFAKYKEKLVCRTISFRPRMGGQNSINILKIIKIGWSAFGDFYRFKKEM